MLMGKLHFSNDGKIETISMKSETFQNIILTILDILKITETCIEKILQNQ